MEADLARLLELQQQVEHPPVDLEARVRSSDEIVARLISNQRQVVEVLIAVAGDLAAREGAGTV